MQVILEVPADKEAAVLAVLGGGAVAAKKSAAPKAAPEPEPVVEDLLGGDGAGATMADAVELATGLVSAGKSADVKAALTAVGAARVSELTEENIQAFVDSLSG